MNQDDEVLRYHNNLWHKYDSLQKARHSHHTALINNDIYHIGEDQSMKLTSYRIIDGHIIREWTLKWPDSFRFEWTTDTYLVLALILRSMWVSYSNKSLKMLFFPFLKYIFSVERWKMKNGTIGEGKIKKIESVILPSVSAFAVTFLLSTEIEELFRGE